MKHKAIPTLLALYLVLSTWKGYIAIFQPGGQEPFQIFPNRVDTLPEKDQQALAEGIRVRSDEAMQQLLEDYLS